MIDKHMAKKTSQGKVINLRLANFDILLQFNPWDGKFEKERIIRAIRTYFRGFITNVPTKKPDYTIQFTGRSAIEVYRKRQKQKRINLINYYEDYSDKTIITFYFISLSMFQNILQFLLHRLLAEKKGCFLHASSVKVKKEAYLFLAPSGGGKSTIMRMLKDTFTPLGDDSAIIRLIKNKYFFYQTPFIEKEYWLRKDKEGYPVGKIFFLNKANQVYVKKITSREFIIEKLANQLISQDIVTSSINMKTLFDFISSHHQFYSLYFDKNQSHVIKLIKSLAEKNL